MHKNIDDFYLFGCTNKDLSTIDDIKNYKLDALPHVNGKKTSLKEAIKELNKIIKQKKPIHFDGLICDQQCQNLVFNWSEKNRSSINHCESDEINNFYSAYQIYGGSLVSFNEVKKRSDFLMFIGEFDDLILKKFIKKLDEKNTKHKKEIYCLNNKKSSIIKNNIEVKKNHSVLNVFFDLFKNQLKQKKFKLLQEKIRLSKYPVIIINPTNGFSFSRCILRSTE